MSKLSLDIRCTTLLHLLRVLLDDSAASNARTDRTDRTDRHMVCVLRVLRRFPHLNFTWVTMCSCNFGKDTNRDHHVQRSFL